MSATMRAANLPALEGVGASGAMKIGADRRELLLLLHADFALFPTSAAHLAPRETSPFYSPELTSWGAAAAQPVCS